MTAVDKRACVHAGGNTGAINPCTDSATILLQTFTFWVSTDIDDSFSIFNQIK